MASPWLLPPPMATTPSSLLRRVPLLRHRLRLRLRLSAAPRWPLCTISGDPDKDIAPSKESPKFHRWNDPDYRQWKDKEDQILNDIQPILYLAKDIIHSKMYMDGERLKPDDQKAVVEKLLVYHPRAEDKIGCGLDSIMVDRHPLFKQSRCLFLIRTDGAWIDFSYQKCLRQYVREKYPSHAERFIREHFKRSST